MVQKFTTPLDQAIENFLENGGDPRWPQAAGASTAFADPFAAAPAAAGKGRRTAPAKPDPDSIDALSPREQVWKSLENEVEEEERTRFAITHRHRPEAPEELPDLSNL